MRLTQVDRIEDRIIIGPCPRIIKQLLQEIKALVALSIVLLGSAGEVAVRLLNYEGGIN